MVRADVPVPIQKRAFVLSPSLPERPGAFVEGQMGSCRNILRGAGVQPR
jgi:hypothetical protein